MANAVGFEQTFDPHNPKTRDSTDLEALVSKPFGEEEGGYRGHLKKHIKQPFEALCSLCTGSWRLIGGGKKVAIKVGSAFYEVNIVTVRLKLVRASARM